MIQPILTGLLFAFIGLNARAAERPPNVVLIITDDQGYGDLGCTGNPVLKTPEIDRLYADSVRLTSFHVDPTCSPTRAALMTGRYSTRVGVWHTVMGRHMPRAEERMMPQAFADSGYTTAMFGKWHLGDNYPFRPQDRGFQDVLMHGGGGSGQIPDAWDNDYFDDTYFRNGKAEKFSGYCTDVFFSEAIRYIESKRDTPFFVYLATNAPHGPYRVADEWSAPYESQVGGDQELAKFYGMIANIDHNVGRLRRRLDELGLAENTILIFMTDNGTARGATFGVGKGADFRGNDVPLSSGYNAGMRGRKGSPYEGGHRVPCFIHWPAGKLAGGRDVGGLTAHFDLLPTLIDLCGLKPKAEVAYDGIDLAAVVRGEAKVPADRILITHHQELAEPEKYRFAAVMQGSWRLIVRNDQSEPPSYTIELYDVQKDPAQNRNMPGVHNDFVTLLFAYDDWWIEMARDFARPAEIVIGSERQNPTELTCFEWYNSPQWWQPAVKRGFEGNGHWSLLVERAGTYKITLRRWPAEVDAPIAGAVDGGKAIPIDSARLKIGTFDEQQPVAKDAKGVTFQVKLPAGSTKMETWFHSPNGTTRGAYYATVRRIDDNPSR
ncbi:MAG: arylsulfatase [Planctomycetes bacterium]|nr:arylsulfatase [Planctomycetota bacterium]